MLSPEFPDNFRPLLHPGNLTGLHLPSEPTQGFSSKKSLHPSFPDFSRELPSLFSEYSGMPLSLNIRRALSVRVIEAISLLAIFILSTPSLAGTLGVR
jgi:hypothetical protein